MHNSFFKSIILTFIFVSSLFSSNEEINQKLFELKTSQEYAQKINDEKITLIMGQIIQKENEIKELEKELKDYVNKEDLQKEITYQNNRIEDINSHVDKLSISVTVVGILITVILLLFTGTFFYVSNKKHLEKVDEWIAKNKDKILEPIQKEANELQENIENKALSFYQSQLKEFKIDEKLSESQKQTQTEIIEKVNEILEHREKEKYTFSDWISKAIDADNKNDFGSALEYIEQAISLAQNDYQISLTLLNKGVILTKDGKANEAIEIYDKVANKFENSKNIEVLINVVNSLHNKGFILGHLGEHNKALEVYKKVVDRFKNSEDNKILEILKSVLVNQIEINLILNISSSKEDVNLYLKLVKGNKNELIKYQMLLLMDKAKNSEIDNEIEEWKSKFENISFLNWSFSELKNWANSFENQEIKERLLRYIDIFENHNKK